jgi:hypothetical protein
MLGLAELKMYLKDEESRLGLKREERERILGARREMLSNRSRLPAADEYVPTDDSNESGTALEDDFTSEGETLRGLFSHFINLVNAESAANSESQDPMLEGDEPEYGNPIKIKLEDLFDFTRHHWIEELRNSAHASFEEELELRDVLDLDAEGEDDIDYHPEDDHEMIFDN